MNWFSSIRAKLLLCFFVFIVLFNILSVSIYVSSSHFTNEYHTSFERFLIFNSISQKASELAEDTKAYVREQNDDHLDSYYVSLEEFRREQNRLKADMEREEDIQLTNYLNLMESLIRNSEITVGFVLRDDIERYTEFLQETQSTASYIQENTLSLIDLELTEYQQLYADLQDRNESFRLFTIFLFINTVMLAVFFAFWFSNGITKPLQTLAAAAKEVSKGNFKGKPVEVHSNDEMKLLGDTFNQMKTDINDYVEKMKEKAEMDRLMKELELKHLQNQIHPHFLFNTLNTVSKMAYLEDAASTSELIESVSVLLRHSLGDIDQSVSLKEEVKVVESYFQIQQTRFQDRVDFVTEIDEHSLHVNVPRLTLQPLVENAFIHGVEALEGGGTIMLSVFSQKDVVVAEVIDNGTGMTQKQVNKVLALGTEDEHTGHSTGLGMTNVIRRLQLHYKAEYVAEIDSKEGEGTTVRLLLPKADETEETA
ncbi:sensor histidine kinase [Alteribacillus sp. JSM 102045]|uniref:sensor histidine kinase n=1 Tax=Alteribacillus sp. JSM 102045 TaxID=1562101 RepID=UPI0035C19F4D